MFSEEHPPILAIAIHLRMSQSLPQNYTQLLQDLMQQVGVSSFRQLSQISSVSEQQIRRLRRGQVSQMRVETLVKLAEALQVPVSELLEQFSPETLAPTTGDRDEELAKLATLEREYQHLQQQLEQQQDSLTQEFRLSSLRVLESFLIYWPTAADKARQNPDLPAVRLLPLVKPIEQLLQQWGVEAIASVGEELPYNPQWHRLKEGTAEPGDLVRVSNVGYRMGDKLLHRATVTPISNLQKA